MNKASLVERIADLVREGKIDGVTDIRDESDRGGMRVVVELRKDAPGEVILNQLYKQTPLQTTFGVTDAGAGRGPPEAALAEGGAAPLPRPPRARWWRAAPPTTSPRPRPAPTSSKASRSPSSSSTA